jgi:hypothetical protein
VKFLMDTDHLSILQKQAGIEYEACRTGHLPSLPSCSFVVCTPSCPHLKGQP